jgi:uncharacterized protein YegP (UPF0339 family)
MYVIKVGSTKPRQFHVVLVAKNNEVLSTSETLTTKASAWRNIQAQISASGMEQGVVYIRDKSIRPYKEWVIPVEGFKAYKPTKA